MLCCPYAAIAVLVCAVWLCAANLFGGRLDYVVRKTFPEYTAKQLLLSLCVASKGYKLYMYCSSTQDSDQGLVMPGAVHAGKQRQSMPYTLHKLVYTPRPLQLCTSLWGATSSLLNSREPLIHPHNLCRTVRDQHSWATLTSYLNGRQPHVAGYLSGS